MASESRQQRNKHMQLRTTTGCLPCRRRRKKCDEAKPSCSGCARNHLICAWPGDQKDIDTKPILSQKSVRNTTQTEEYGLITKRAPRILTRWYNPSDRPPSLRIEQHARLLDHYISRTAPRLASKCQPENPFLTYNLCVAWESETMQHTLLALSSADMLPSEPGMTEATRAHYAVALRSVKHGLTLWASMSSVQRLSLLASTLTLCWFEVLDCNQDGALYHHLTASKVMLKDLIESKTIPDQHLLGFFIEQYAYMAIVSNFTLQPPSLYRNAHDPSLYGSLELLNQGSSIYGFIFGHGHRIFELIPRIANLAHQRQSCGEALTLDLVTEFNNIHQQLAEISHRTAESMASFGDDFVIASHVYQEACHIFLHTSYHGPHPPTDELYGRIQPHLDTFLLYYAALSYETGPWTTTLWPMVIAGSCMRQPDQQQLLVSIISQSVPVFGMACYTHTLQLVNRMWEAQKQDPTFYGPWGLQQAMNAAKFRLCMG